MKNLLLIAAVLLLLAGMAGCQGSKGTSQTATRDTLYVHDTLFIHDTVPVTVMPAGEMIYNIPCKVVSLHPERPGKALLVVWLHGGCGSYLEHDWLRLSGKSNHLTNCAADDSIVAYLERHDRKAVVLMPMCHKADRKECVMWPECWPDVKRMINDLVGRGIVDQKRVYLAGSSDGGLGAWDFASKHGDVFAAAISQSCATPKEVSIPVYFSNTRSEWDCTAWVNELRKKGSDIHYEYCHDVGHGGDAKLCTDSLLTLFFSHTK